MTVLSWPLDLDRLEAAAGRCAKFETYFDTNSKGIPITTTDLPGLSDDALAYQQTMQLMVRPVVFTWHSRMWAGMEFFSESLFFPHLIPASTPKRHCHRHFWMYLPNSL